MQNLRILIVEDELIIAMDTQAMLEEIGYTVCGIASSYEEAVCAIREKRPDLLLLDIGLRNSRTGIDIAKVARAKEIPFIFTTSYADPAMIEQAKETRPYGYLIKPCTKIDLYAAIEMAISHFQKEEEPGLFLPMGRNKHRVSLKDLVFIKANGNYVELKIGDRRVALRKNLKEFEAKLPLGHPFMRVHKSYLVNRDHIQSFNQLELLLLDGTHLPIGRTFFPDLKASMLIV
ncbi:LytTR family DNA-binding domain-containing protein [Olivibacter sp. XZL3]|uniref:LytR/AlgR family response regulator transcription factor n=1 Tax=Olivibacter sp. XZL3 TaxID=1735116 RepID=UPI001065F0D8|nr:LytTR family transcriptional regulator DNA-binding domain-containing protein [Olivibacter sp. XZL3]